jgi:hypothetical protein
MNGVLTTTEPTTLTAHDRCDVGGCGAQAYVVVNLLLNGPLMFCGHHFAANETNLTACAVSIHDERERLTATSKLDVSA